MNLCERIKLIGVNIILDVRDPMRRKRSLPDSDKVDLGVFLDDIKTSLDVRGTVLVECFETDGALCAVVVVVLGNAVLEGLKADGIGLHGDETVDTGLGKEAVIPDRRPAGNVDSQAEASSVESSSKVVEEGGILAGIVLRGSVSALRLKVHVVADHPLTLLLCLQHSLGDELVGVLPEITHLVDVGSSDHRLNKNARLVKCRTNLGESIVLQVRTIVQVICLNAHTRNNLGSKRKDLVQVLLDVLPTALKTHPWHNSTGSKSHAHQSKLNENGTEHCPKKAEKKKEEKRLIKERKL